ncbi:hypothetical protein [Nocardia salmonicida]|uniref:hypothetical protein n=1 Tax=Nocardia salmonicida TaxID=53431 RepID=UPI0007A3E164|nr:hypothetical protein [Nocardia salmonicida]
MTEPIKHRVAKLTERAARRNLGLRLAKEPPYGWELDNAFRVVCTGTIDQIEAWLTAAESGTAYSADARRRGTQT